MNTLKKFTVFIAIILISVCTFASGGVNTSLALEIPGDRTVTPVYATNDVAEAIFNGGFSNFADTDFSGGRVLASDVKGAYAEFSFIGSYIGWLTQDAGGHYNIYIDGIKIVDNGVLGNSGVKPFLGYEKSDLSEDNHTIKVEHATNFDWLHVGGFITKKYSTNFINDNVTTTTGEIDKITTEGMGYITAGVKKCFNSDYTYGNISTAKVEMNFTGKIIALVVYKTSDGGVAKITLDGVNKGNFSYKVPEYPEWKWILFAKTDLSEGSHNIKVEWVSGDVGVDGFLVEPLAPADFSGLVSMIDQADSLNDSLNPGTEIGQVPQSAKDIFVSAIAAAQAVLDNPASTQDDVDHAKTTLSSAMTVFNASVIKAVTTSALSAKIDEVQNILNSAVAGSDAGQYPQSAIDAMNASLNEAKVQLATADLTQDQVDIAFNNLVLEMEAFEMQKNDSSTDDVKTGDTGILLFAISGIFALCAVILSKKSGHSKVQ